MCIKYNVFDHVINELKSSKNVYITIYIYTTVIFIIWPENMKLMILDTFVMIRMVCIEIHNFHLARAILYCLSCDNYGLIEQ